MHNFFEKLSKINSFLKIFSISKKILIIIAFLMVIQSVAEAFSATLLIPFLNSIQNVQASTTGDNTFLRLIDNIFSDVKMEHRFIYILMSILILMSAVQFMIIFNNRLILNFSMFKVQNAVSNALFNKILNARLRYFYKKRSGDLINNLTMDVNRVQNCLIYLLKMSSDAFFVLGYFIVGFLVLPVYSAGMIVFFLLFTGVFTYILPYIHGLGKKNREAQEEANNIIVESMQGFRNILLSCAQQDIKNRYSKIIFGFYNTIYHSSWITTSLPTFFRFLAIMAIMLVLLLNKSSIVGGDPAIFSKILFFIFIAGNIFKHIGSINSQYSSFTFGYEGLRVLLELNDQLEAHKQSGDKLKKLDGFSKNITFNNLCFDYIDSIPVLNNLSFSIAKNEKIAFVGKSGSGKSTLVDIISGFHDDYVGNIEINGIDFKEINKDSWRQILGYVSQETFVFNDTIKNNLTFGFDHEISDTELYRACEKSQILDSILSFEHGFDTVLGERGVRLSGGEKQRLAIARLFLKKPEIILLDEATSSLDSESEKKVKEALYALCENRTVIAVAHRLSTIADYDVIHVLENGQIVESGNHSELISRKGRYYEYYTIQVMGDNNGE